MRTRTLLCALAALALLGGSLLQATPQTQPAGKLTVTYLYLPG